ncbi:hypothetical protein [Crateriforma conspicua]|uniref:hypothetical protein n=1 Tax=Crateriforma TaxID=2714592 RepID=UPI0011B7226E|nr:hypothetical protein [Crateriforma conspicua]
MNLDATNPYTPPNTQQFGSDLVPYDSGDEPASLARAFAAIAIGLVSLLPLAAFVAACIFIYGRGWPASTFRGALHTILLSMFILAFVSLVIVSVATYRRQRRGIVLGVCGTLAAIAIYIPAAMVAEGYFR